MKVVLFCGGFGMRIRNYSEDVPKPMLMIGFRPIIWHVMKYYAHFGHRDFILCLGWRANIIKDYFLNYNECQSNDFVYAQGGKDIRLSKSDIHDWRITFVDTGMQSSVGERLRLVRPYLDGERQFLANYTDGLTDLNLDNLVAFHQTSSATATFMSVRPTQSFHAVQADQDGRVSGIEPISHSDTWMNAGCFVLEREIFDYLGPGQDLVDEPFRRLIQEDKLSTYRHDGFFGCMDTLKEKQALDKLYANGNAKWEVWKTPPSAAAAHLPHPDTAKARRA